MIENELQTIEREDHLQRRRTELKEKENENLGGVELKTTKRLSPGCPL